LIDKASKISVRSSAEVGDGSQMVPSFGSFIIGISNRNFHDVVTVGLSVIGEPIFVHGSMLVCPELVPGMDWLVR
jgi:hypothetical protein